MMVVATFSAPQTPSELTESSTNHEENPNSNTIRGSFIKDNDFVVKKKPRGRQVPSRYLSPSPSPSSTTAAKIPARFPSTLISRSTNTTAAAWAADKNTKMVPSRLLKLSQSVDRRRPGGQVLQGNNVDSAELSAATKMLITSTRSLSVSFQGEAFSLPISKTKFQGGSTLSKKASPERRRATSVRDHRENSKPVDQHRWPERTRQGNSGSNPLSRSLDYFGERNLLGGSGAVLVKSLQQSLMLDDSSRRISFDANCVNEASCASCDLTASDSDSVSSGSTNSGMQECGGNGISKGRSGSGSVLASARFWQETNSRLRRLQDPGSPLSTIPGGRIGAMPSPRTMASPIRGGTRPGSPSKIWTSSASSPSRGLSPTRVRNAVGGQMIGGSVNTPSILSFSVDIRRGKVGEDRIVDAHMLRLLYNRYLQWRFANARAEAVFMVQELHAEKDLCNAWVTTSELQYSATLKRIKLLLVRQKLKLTSILKGQISHLEPWVLLDGDHTSSLLGATEALKASTLRLPIVGQAIVDIQNLKDAVSSAVDVMHAMASSICSLSSKVEEMNSSVNELMSVAANERVLLEQCNDHLSMIAAIQVTDCSLRSHILQRNRVSATGCLATRV
ncbi:QWRF motif-containing protein 2 [Hibiscus syriacus]|uniref:QWRF motif-containing protein 2 n=1 Tax=Hibiscus syriacus TaxID=106335 RepID=A0A6A2X0I7_HIBSY|nr:QWRF motif-containing protein 2-like [Hibiscus syriacus]KAE8668133.1 QWRF motif-containing protein 2 [Hibiscus syriacus]